MTFTSALLAVRGLRNKLLLAENTVEIAGLVLFQRPMDRSVGEAVRALFLATHRGEGRESVFAGFLTKECKSHLPGFRLRFLAQFQKLPLPPVGFAHSENEGVFSSPRDAYALLYIIEITAKNRYGPHRGISENALQASDEIFSSVLHGCQYPPLLSEKQ